MTNTTVLRYNIISQCLPRRCGTVKSFSHGNRRHWPLGHVNKISCFSSFCLQKFGEGGGYLLFIFRGQRSYATIFTGVKLEESKGKQEQHRSKKSENKQKNGFNLSMDVRMLELSFIFTIANESVM